MKPMDDFLKYLKKEIKSYDMTDAEKVHIFSKVEEVKDFCGVIKVFDKKIMTKEIVESNIFFNYAVIINVCNKSVSKSVFRNLMNF